MTENELKLVKEALDFLYQLPSGIDPDDVHEDDTSPEDTVVFYGSIAAKRLIAAIRENRGLTSSNE